VQAITGIGSPDPRPAAAEGYAPARRRHDRAADRQAGPLRRDRALLAAHAGAWSFYRAQLQGSWVPDYLAGRKITAALQQQWGIGYAPARWTALTSSLRAAGYPDAVIEAAGLAVRSRRGTLIDLFRDRVMFPVHDESGGVVAFVGRVPPAAEGPDIPRYLNSPATVIYRKGEVLFGLHQARDRLTEGARAVVCEGVFDAVAVSAASRRLAGLAALGTAFTPQHAAALAGVTAPARPRVLVAFDPDRGGRQAALAAYWALIAVTTDVEAAVLPEGSDPARLLETAGPAALARVLTQASQPLADLVTDDRVGQLARLATSWDGYDRLATVEGTYVVLREAARLIAAMPPAHIARQAARLAARLGVTGREVTAAIADAITGT
jgi:DNA primase